MKKSAHYFLFWIFLWLIGIDCYAYDFESNGIYYNYVNKASGGEVAVTRIDNTTYNSMTTISIPDEVKDWDRTYWTFKVTGIEDDAFYYCKNLTSIRLPSNLKTIGERAFGYCESLESLELPNSVTSIGNSAFYCCSGLTSITLGNNVENIANQAFEKCTSLTSLNIPASVTSFKGTAIHGCTSLSTIRVASGNAVYDSRNNCNAIIETSTNTLIATCKNSTIPDGIEKIGNNAFYDLTTRTSLTLPESVKEIGQRAFYNCSSLKNINLQNITSFGESAFNGCTGLGSLYLDNAESIGELAFGSCTNMSSVTFTNKLISIGDYAFENCSGLYYIIIPKSVTNIGYRAFNLCNNLGSIQVENPTPITLTSQPFYKLNARLYVPYGSVMAYSAADYWKDFNIIEMEPTYVIFADNQVKSICVANWDTDGDGVLSKEEAAAVTDLGTVFKGNTKITSFDELQFFTGLTTIGYNAFRGCTGLTAITIPENVTSIGNAAFDGCTGLTSIDIPNSVTSIGIGAFFSCTGLTSITIPESVTSIGNAAFYGCTGLTSVNFGDNSQLESIGNQAFYYCTGLTSVNFGDNSQLESIGNQAFYGCSSLTSFTIPNKVTSIGNQAFYYCTGLTSITIPNSVTSLGNNVFEHCRGLTSISVESGNTHFDSRNTCNAIIYTSRNYLVSGCKNTIIPEDVTIIGESAFVGCTGLTSITIPESVTSIVDNAFQNCSGLTSVTIPNSVTSIGGYAFSSCSGLTSVTIGSNVESIGESAFYNCGKLAKVKVGKTSPVSIYYDVFMGRAANSTLYVPKGSESSYASANYWKGFTAIKEYPDGDVNADGEIDVVDVVDIARYAVGTPGTAFDDFLADINIDYTVNVADAVVLVNEIAGDTQFARSFMTTLQSCEKNVLTLCSNNDSRLSLHMEGNAQYTAFQFDLWTPKDIELIQVALNSQRRQGHQLLYNKVSDGHYRMVVLSTSNNVFKGTSGELLGMMLDGFDTNDIRVDNIHFVTTDGIDVPFDALGLSDDSVTDIHTTKMVGSETRDIYNMNGQRLIAPQKGLNIIGGKIVLVK